MAPTRLTGGQRLRAAAIAAVVSPLAGLLGRTWRWQVDGLSHYDAIVRAGRQPIFALWHGRILPATIFWRDRGIVVITSENFDGEWIARIIRRFGYGTARGSTSRGGARALVQLRRDLDAGRPAGFTLDGPRGPARVAQPGALWLAGASGHPVLPFHIEASRAWTLSSWDRAQVPRPRSLVAMAIAPPLIVPDTAATTIAASSEALTRALEDAERRAIAMLADHS